MARGRSAAHSNRAAFRFNFRRAGMSGGPVVPQSSSGQWLIALRQHRGRDTIARRSASACLSACRGTPQACSGFRPAAFGSFVISQAPADGRFLLASVGKPIAVAAGEQAPGPVQLGDAATAIHSVCSNRTHKPGLFSTEPARRPGDGDTLLDIAPILAI